MSQVGKLQEYGDEQQLEVATDLSDAVQLVVHNGGLIQYIYLDADDVPRLIRQLSKWEEEVLQEVGREL